MKVKIKALDQTIETGRVIGSYSHDRRGPGLVVTAGIHGNEPSGVFALKRVFEALEKEDVPIKGRLTGLAGNLKGLSKDVRYIDQDLNRLWLSDNIRKAEKDTNGKVHEIKEMAEILKELNKAHDELITQLYFLDCHTTSSESQPYISVHDFPHSFYFAANFPAYTVKGLPKFIPGTIDDYLNGRGYIGFTYEAGQHDDLSSIENQEAAIWLSLAHCGCLDYDTLGCYPHCNELMSKYIVEGKKSFKVLHCYKIKEGEGFKMRPGYVNFQKIKKGEVLADNKSGEIKSEWNARILMPLYQAQGDDGFFIVKEIEHL